MQLPSRERVRLQVQHGGAKLRRQRAAAGERGEIRQRLGELAQLEVDAGQPMFDLKTDAGRAAAYEAVLEFFVKTYGGEQVLATPRTKFSWLLPSLAVIGGLGLLVVAGRRWVGRGSDVATTSGAAAPRTEDAAYADKLDDELADTD